MTKTAKQFLEGQLAKQILNVLKGDTSGVESTLKMYVEVTNAMPEDTPLTGWLQEQLINKFSKKTFEVTKSTVTNNVETFEVEADNEEEAIDMVMQGKGTKTTTDSYTNWKEYEAEEFITE
jgi:hypothetical protein